MSMISEQVNLLRDAVIRLQALDLPNTAKEVKEAADTIEELSEKLASANMERSTAYYNDGWIPVSERLPEEHDSYLVWWTDLTNEEYYEIVEYHPEEGWIGDIPQAYKGRYTVIAWRELPAPYQPKGEK